MHSRIFQLIKMPMDQEEDYEIDEFSSCLEYFSRKVDYIVPVDEADKATEFEWLGQFLEKYGITYDLQKSILTFPTDFKTAYATQKFKAFQEIIKTVKEEDFKVKFSWPIYLLQDLIRDEFGSQIIEDADSLYTLDDFLRQLEEGIEHQFYVNKIFDFHY